MPPKKSSSNHSTDDSTDVKILLEEHFLKIQKKIDDSEASVKTYFDNKFRLLETKITELETISFNASKISKEAISKVHDFEETIEFNDEKIDILRNKSEAIDERISSLNKKINVLTSRLEDQTNRASRKTLIIRGVKETEAEKTWDDTKQIVADVIREKCDYDIDPDEFIERAHRGRKIAGKSVRDIHACFYDWNEVNNVLKGFQKNGFSRKDNIFIEQRYGPITTWRRNKAKLLRKQLIVDKKIISGYVAYPAKLMVKNTRDGKYFVHTDFSDAEVTDEAGV